MNRKEFELALFAYYGQEIGSETGKIRLKMLDIWLEKNIQDKYLSVFFEKIINKFEPTSTTKMPLLSHLNKLKSRIRTQRNVLRFEEHYDELN